MTIDWQALEAGCCKRGTDKARECSLCAPRLAAIDRLREVIEAADALRACGIDDYIGWCAACGHDHRGGEPQHHDDCTLVAFDRVRGGGDG
jgi:hypothetical protein